jgi:hypothetical protein
MKFAALMLAVLFHARVSVASAQDEPHVKLLLTRIAVRDSVARADCVEIPPREPYAGPQLAHSCRIVSFDTLPRAAGRRWIYAVQRHVYVHDSSDSAKKVVPDTLVEIEALLYASGPNTRLLSAVLYAREDEEIVRGITPDIGAQSGSALLGMELCLNGTGGCWQEFLRYDGATWHRVADPGDAIQSRVRRVFRGDASHEIRSPRIDVRTLRGTAAIASPGDANCCPSHRANFELALDGNRFRIVRFKVVAND